MRKVTSFFLIFAFLIVWRNCFAFEILEKKTFDTAVSLITELKGDIGGKTWSGEEPFSSPTPKYPPVLMKKKGTITILTGQAPFTGTVATPYGTIYANQVHVVTELRCGSMWNAPTVVKLRKSPYTIVYSGKPPIIHDKGILRAPNGEYSTADYKVECGERDGNTPFLGQTVTHARSYGSFKFVGEPSSGTDYAVKVIAADIKDYYTAIPIVEYKVDELPRVVFTANAATKFSRRVNEMVEINDLIDVAVSSPDPAIKPTINYTCSLPGGYKSETQCKELLNPQKPGESVVNMTITLTFN